MSGEDLDVDLLDGNLSAGITVDQPVYYRNALYFYDALKEKAKASPFSIQIAEQNLMMSVTDAYFNALKAGDRVALSESELYAVQRQLEQTQKRFEVGFLFRIRTWHTAHNVQRPPFGQQEQVKL